MTMPLLKVCERVSFSDHHETVHIDQVISLERVEQF
jgi:hypothetical protein